MQAIQLRDSGLWCWSLRDKGGEYFRVCVENGKMLSLRSWRIVLPGVVLLAICAAYANHFQNSFHFDDAAAAFAHLRSGTHLGKIVIQR